MSQTYYEDIRIIYEDNHLLVVDKPVNMPSQQDRSGDKDILTHLKKYIKVKYHKPGNVYLGLVHRLDRPVGVRWFLPRLQKLHPDFPSKYGPGSLVKDIWQSSMEYPK